MKYANENELMYGMERELNNSIEKSEAVNSLDKAVEFLNSAAEALDDAGFTSQSDAILNILLKIAEKNDRHTQGLTPDKMVKNLLDHGTEFNLSDDSSEEFTADDLSEFNVDDDDNSEDLLYADIMSDDDELEPFSLDMDFEDEL